MSNRGRRGKGPQRVLYWFRTPPGVKVGRGAIDEEAIRLIEQHNPEIQFDWASILREPPAPAQPRKDDRRPARDRRGAPRETRPAAASAPRRATEYAQTTAPATVEQTESVATDYAEYTERDGAESAEPQEIEPLEPIELADVEPPEPLELADPEPLEPEQVERAEPPEPREPSSAAEARVGAEGLARLRGRYAEVMARIGERPLDEQTREELKQRAERLNPDTWVTSDEVAQALEVYESVYEGLRAVVGSGHRRRRGRGRRPSDQKPQV